MNKYTRHNRAQYDFPTICIAIPTYNEQQMITSCLDSLFSQDYPKQKMQIIIIDDDSKDRTLSIVKEYPVKILHNGTHDAERGKLIAYRACKSELFCYLDADITLMGNDWLKNMTYPLIRDREISGVFTKFVGRDSDTSLQRYYNLSPLQLDPIFQFFSPSIESKVIKHSKFYDTCEFGLFSIPPIGICIYKTLQIRKYLRLEERYME
jgi:glycosyltransferase involved in cell wall biosynthesis